jgi:hypothetical protein
MPAQQTNQRLVVSLVVGGVLMFAALVSLLATGGSGGHKTSLDVKPAASGSLTKAAAPEAPAPELPRGSFDVYAGRDPFQPPIDVTSAAASTGAASTATGAGAAATGASASTGASTGAANTSTAAPSQNPAPAKTIALVEVDGTSAKVQVGGTMYTVAAGQTFATSYKLVSLSGNCGAFLFGDSSFSLCTGEQVIK